MSYPCTMCGACCRRIKSAVEVMEKLDSGFVFPHKWDESGKCEMLDEDNTCRVYDSRPCPAIAENRLLAEVRL